MKRAALLLFALVVLAGCATTSPRGSRLMPWNWFSSDSSKKIEEAHEDRAAAETEMRKHSQELVEATKGAILAEIQRQLATGSPASREIQTAADLNGRAAAGLAQSEGALPSKRLLELEDMVKKMNSELAAERDKGGRMLAAIDKLAAAAAQERAEAIEREQAAQAKIGAEQQRALAAEEKYHKLKFYAFALIGGFLFIQILPALSAVFPAIAPVAKLGSNIVAPLVTKSLSKMQHSVGSLIARAESAGTITADMIRTHFDGPLTEDHQAAIAKSYSQTKSAQLGGK